MPRFFALSAPASGTGTKKTSGNEAGRNLDFDKTFSISALKIVHDPQFVFDVKFRFPVKQGTRNSKAEFRCSFVGLLETGISVKSVQVIRELEFIVLFLTDAVKNLTRRESSFPHRYTSVLNYLKRKLLTMVVFFRIQNMSHDLCQYVTKFLEKWKLIPDYACVTE